MLIEWTHWGHRLNKCDLMESPHLRGVGRSPKPKVKYYHYIKCMLILIVYVYQKSNKFDV